MFALKDGPILPGVGIGRLRLGMSRAEVERIIGKQPYEALPGCDLFRCEDVTIWLDTEHDRVKQITVKDGFLGKYDGWLGIGSTLGDAARRGMSWHELDEVFFPCELDGVEGMCLEHAGDADDDWDEESDFERYNQSLPIAFISVYDREGG